MELTKINDIGYSIFGKPDEEYHIGAIYEDKFVLAFPYMSNELSDFDFPNRIPYKVKIIDEKGAVKILKRVNSLEDEVLDIIRTMQNDKEYSQSIFDYLSPILNLDDVEREYLLCSDNGRTHNIALNKNSTSTIDNSDLDRKRHLFYYIDHPYIVEVYDKERELYNLANTRTNKLLLHKWVDGIGDYGYNLDTLASFKVVKNVTVAVRKIAKDVYAYNMLDHEGNLVFGHDLIIYTKRYALTYDYLVKSKRNKYNFAHLNDFLLLDKFIDFSSLKEINPNDLKKL